MNFNEWVGQQNRNKVDIAKELNMSYVTFLKMCKGFPVTKQMSDKIRKVVPSDVVFPVDRKIPDKSHIKKKTPLFKLTRMIYNQRKYHERRLGFEFPKEWITFDSFVEIKGIMPWGHCSFIKKDKSKPYSNSNFQWKRNSLQISKDKQI